MIEGNKDSADQDSSMQFQQNKSDEITSLLKDERSTRD